MLFVHYELTIRAGLIKRLSYIYKFSRIKLNYNKPDKKGIF